jgi:hypothetical protein
MNRPPKSGWNGGQLVSNRDANRAANRGESVACSGAGRANWFESAKSILAVVGLAAITLRLVKFVR